MPNRGNQPENKKNKKCYKKVLTRQSGCYITLDMNGGAVSLIKRRKKMMTILEKARAIAVEASDREQKTLTGGSIAWDNNHEQIKPSANLAWSAYETLKAGADGIYTIAEAAEFVEKHYKKGE